MRLQNGHSGKECGPLWDNVGSQAPPWAAPEKARWGGRQGNTGQGSSQHLQTTHEKGHLGCISDVTRDIVSRRDAIQKLKGICLKYNKVSNNSKSWRVWQGAGTWVWGTEFSDAGWWVSQWVTWEWLFPPSLPTFRACEETLPLLLLSDSLKWRKQGASWLRRYKARAGTRDKDEADKYTFIFLLCSAYSLTSSFCYLPFLSPPISWGLLLSVLPVVSGNLQSIQDQELLTHCALRRLFTF